ncbi:MAG: hypothetical protein ACRECV_04065 [Xanthobacteraceae bacterium]
MNSWLKNNASVVWWWAGLIAATAIIFGATRGTQLAQLGIGLLAAAITLLVAVAVFEVIWQIAVNWTGSKGGKATPDRTPKHRQRGQ